MIFNRCGPRCGVILAAYCLCASASCTQLLVRPYRNDALATGYRYPLGEKYVEVDHLKICFEEFGQGETVLILPGLGTSIDFYQENIPALAAHYHVVALDLPGFGKSDKPDVPYKLTWTCEVILKFMDVMKIDKAHVIGGSMGGHLAMMLALDHRERVQSIVLMGSTGDWRSPGPVLRAGVNACWNEAIVTEYIRGHWPSIFRKLIRHPTPMTDQILKAQMAVRANKQLFFPEGRASARTIMSIYASSCRDRLPSIQVPTLLIWGEDDEIHTVKHARFMHEHIPGSQLIVLNDAGHWAMIDRRDRFNHEVLEFFEHATRPQTPVAMQHEP